MKRVTLFVLSLVACSDGAQREPEREFELHAPQQPNDYELTLTRSRKHTSHNIAKLFENTCWVAHRNNETADEFSSRLVSVEQNVRAIKPYGRMAQWSLDGLIIAYGSRSRKNQKSLLCRLTINTDEGPTFASVLQSMSGLDQLGKPSTINLPKRGGFNSEWQIVRSNYNTAHVYLSELPATTRSHESLELPKRLAIALSHGPMYLE